MVVAVAVGATVRSGGDAVGAAVRCGGDAEMGFTVVELCFACLRFHIGGEGDR